MANRCGLAPLITFAAEVFPDPGPPVSTTDCTSTEPSGVKGLESCRMVPRSEWDRHATPLTARECQLPARHQQVVRSAQNERAASIIASSLTRQDAAVVRCTFRSVSAV